VGCENSAGPVVRTEDPTNIPVAGLSADEQALFAAGDKEIDSAFRDTDGLGPLYIEASCATCHSKDARGPGKAERMAIANLDGTTASHESALPYGTVIRRHYVAGATQGLLPPEGAPGLLLSTRIGPALFARGRFEAVDDATLLDEEAKQAQDGRVSGKVNR